MKFAVEPMAHLLQLLQLVVQSSRLLQLDGESVPLDLGREKRLFDKNQTIDQDGISRCPPHHHMADHPEHSTCGPFPTAESGSIDARDR